MNTIKLRNEIKLRKDMLAISSLLAASAALVLAAPGCVGSGASDDSDPSDQNTGAIGAPGPGRGPGPGPGPGTNTGSGSGTSTGSGSSTSTSQASVNPDLFIKTKLASSITEVSCKLSDGSTSMCYQFTVSEMPSEGYGPWCPKTVNDVGGYWVDNGKIDGKQHQVDGAYLKALDAANGWSLVNSDGTVNVTSSSQFSLVASQENSGWSYDQASTSGVINHCIEATPTTHSQKILLPKTPVASTGQFSLSDVPGMGIALNAILYFPPEPQARIETYHNIAPLDARGGHTGFGLDYHYHRAYKLNGVPDASTGVYGYLFDGYPIYGEKESDGSTPSDLDSCRGHTTQSLGYHYHASSTYPYITTCLHGAYPTEMGHG